MPKCTINGKEVDVREGATIIEAFQVAGENIAYYCWHPGLTVAGVCRMCMVEIEGNPRLQIACNTQVTEGMKVSNRSEKVKESVKWTLDFHLVNHPLDCPICDQAGECGLQEYYMAYGKYDPEMGQAKVKKQKVVDLGPTVVLDSERCILCSRCVRFTDEVTKTNELGIFNRGDRSEIGIVEGRPLKNDYSVNVVDICPVGALTSKDFRFKQRVWYLKDFNTICQGCSTGCSVKVYHNQSGTYRVKPVYNKDVNGYWMCDAGRDVYKFVNPEFRQRKARRKHANGETEDLKVMTAAQEAGRSIREAASKGADKVAIVLTGQYTTEEYQALLKFAKDLKLSQAYHWKNNEETFDNFDGLLIRGDKNPNTQGLLKVMEQHGFNTQWKDLVSKIESGKIDTLVVAGPENLAVFPDLKDKAILFSKVKNVVWFTACKDPSFDSAQWLIPTKTFAEKTGTFVNYKGVEQKIQRGVDFIPEALTLTQAVRWMGETESATLAATL